MSDRLVWIAACCTVTGFAVFAQAQSPEVKVSSSIFGDTEFDWGRDGISCPSCNFGEGNNRFNWTDQDGNLWIGHVDPNTGAITPENGMNELADTSAFNWSAFGNGPEWAFGENVPAAGIGDASGKIIRYRSTSFSRRWLNDV